MKKAVLIMMAIAMIAINTPSNTYVLDDTRKDPPADFKGDGCTKWPDGDYGDCCFEHDKAYYRGGTKIERRAADDKLYECVRGKGHKHISRMMWLGVRIAGGAWTGKSFRWGFGQDKPNNNK